ncbi:MAG: sucrase ferredoxin [Actinomycetes bacterium]
MTLTCSAQRLALGEPLAGSAPHARLWVMLEQPGPWGRDAVRESHLDASVAEALAALPGGRAVRVGLIRAVGEHADVSPRPRTLLVARTDADASWIAARQVDDLKALPAQLDVDAMLASASAPGDLPGVRLPTPTRALLVCTNAKRDQCCAVFGRPLAAYLAERASAGDAVQVWETSHTSGHRFAPTYLSLPDGYLFGGPDAEHATVDSCRGRSSLEPTAQVAELAVLRESGASTPRPLEVSPIDDLSYLVRDNGEVFTVSLKLTTAPDRPESCGKAAVPASWYSANVTRA